MPTSSPHSLKKEPFTFDEFIESGFEESISPFLTPRSKKWSYHLSLKASIAAASLLPIAFFLSFFPSLVPLSHLLLIAVYFLAGIPSLIESIEDIGNLQINIDVLMTLAAFLSILIGSSMEGALLLVLFSLSGSIEEVVSTKAKGAISHLRTLAPAKACVVDDNGLIYERSIREITIGTPILIKAGEVVPLDGIVSQGTSSVNLVHLTGENLPLIKTVGDSVPAGGRNLDGALILKVTHTSGDSTLARLVELITRAQEARPKIQRWIDRLSNRYALTIICLAFIFGVFLPFFTSLSYFGIEGSIYRALAFLIAASPCAIVIAIPVAYLSSISACARSGILLKGGVILDALMKCKTIAFDKTGTLTLGQLACTSVEEVSGQGNLQDALAIALSMEQNAVHPVARAITQYTTERKILPLPVEQFKSIPGYGLEAITTLKGVRQPVYIGHPSYIQAQLTGPEQEILKKKQKEAEEAGQLLTLLRIGSQLIFFRFQDQVRPQVKELIQSLQTNHQLKTVMLTGDHAVSATLIAKELGIDEVFSDLKPEDKLSYIDKLSAQTDLAMVGDGINDAPAMARATVGISMGQVGSSTAIDASDIVLLHDKIELLSWLFDKAQKTQLIVYQNVFIALGAILFATTPALLGFVPLWLAVILHEGGTVLVGLNGLRLLKKSPS